LQEAHRFLQSFFTISNSHGANHLLHNVLFVNKKATVQLWKVSQILYLITSLMYYLNSTVNCKAT